MKQKFIIVVLLVLLIAILVGLNAASYKQKEKTPDSEFAPNRSSFNSGATGTQAFYSLLAETGRRPVRWQESPSGLLAVRSNAPSVFVVIGSLRRDFTPVETEALLRWVSEGGRLVVVDREPAEALTRTTANWKVLLVPSDDTSILKIDPTDQPQMIAGMTAVKPVQPSLLTQGVNAIQPSRFASSIAIERYTDDPPPKAVSNGLGSAPPRAELFQKKKEAGRLYTIPSPTPLQPLPPASTLAETVEPPNEVAPLVHISDGSHHLLVEVPFGNGQIVYLSDPFILSNAGIGLVDNGQLGLNLPGARDAIVAFDEFHQGFGTDSNRFLQFFEGTPVVAIFFQAVLLIGLTFFSQSRRFARAVPEVEPDRLSKLEYIAAMAELQQRTKAVDLAIENIYREFRRRSTRYLGLDNFTSKTDDIAARISDRTGADAASVNTTLLKCEEIIRGEPTNRREAVHLAAELRGLEKLLGIVRTNDR